MSQVLFEIKNLSKSYKFGKKTIKVLDEINFSIKKEEFLAIEGPSGSGKTTLLNLLGGLDRPDKGEILFEGKNIFDLNDKELAFYRSKKIGFVFQFFNLMPHLSVIENIVLPKFFSGDFDKKEDYKFAQEILSKVGLEGKENRKPSELSGGEQQRTAIARALIQKPKAVLLDEPTGNLDYKNTIEIFKLLSELNQKEKTTIIIATHDQTIEKFAKKFLRIKEGKIYEN